MDYREWPPHPARRPFVRTYWALRGSGAETPPQPVLPDGSSELIVHRARPFRRHTAEPGAQRQSARLLVGQMRAPVVLQADGPADVESRRRESLHSDLLDEGMLHRKGARRLEKCDITSCVKSEHAPP